LLDRDGSFYAIQIIETRAIIPDRQLLKSGLPTRSENG
jgi:hypothetical protein